MTHVAPPAGATTGRGQRSDKLERMGTVGREFLARGNIATCCVPAEGKPVVSRGSNAAGSSANHHDLVGLSDLCGQRRAEDRLSSALSGREQSDLEALMDAWSRSSTPRTRCRQRCNLSLSSGHG